jgi:hypothetical protein
MSAPQWSAFVTALVSALDAALDVDVYDGPTVSGSDAASCVVIGARFDDDDTDSGRFSLEYRTDGGASATMDETLNVNCALRYWLGDPDIAAARAGAFALLEDISDTLRGNASLGVAVLLWCHVSVGDVSQELISGAQVTVNFTITARAII